MLERITAAAPAARARTIAGLTPGAGALRKLCVGVAEAVDTHPYSKPTWVPRNRGGPLPVRCLVPSRAVRPELLRLRLEPAGPPCGPRLPGRAWSPGPRGCLHQGGIAGKTVPPRCMAPRTAPSRVEPRWPRGTGSLTPLLQRLPSTPASRRFLSNTLPVSASAIEGTHTAVPGTESWA